jgi:hypothetical protein
MANHIMLQQWLEQKMEYRKTPKNKISLMLSQYVFKKKDKK